jgi:aminoglycoside 6'-N-acetyltransferase I
VIRITGLVERGETALRQAAGLLMEPAAFDWPDMEAALSEVRACAGDGNIVRAAVDGDAVLGWIGGQPRHGTDIWELHPLVVRADRQRRGIGSALVADLERLVQAHGAHTMFVAADNDVRVEPSQAWTDLYAHIAERVRELPAAGNRQYEFYRRCGYVIVGVVPDGRGNGNIYMAKRMGAHNRT